MLLDWIKLVNFEARNLRKVRSGSHSWYSSHSNLAHKTIADRKCNCNWNGARLVQQLQKKGCVLENGISFSSEVVSIKRNEKEEKREGPNLAHLLSLHSTLFNWRESQPKSCENNTNKNAEGKVLRETACRLNYWNADGSSSRWR